eukprot:551887-Prymnesium_polylepis.1
MFVALGSGVRVVLPFSPAMLFRSGFKSSGGAAAEGLLGVAKGRGNTGPASRGTDRGGGEGGGGSEGRGAAGAVLTALTCGKHTFWR